PRGTPKSRQVMGVVQPALHRRTTRALRTRVSSGHVVMLLAGALGVLLTLSVLRAADHSQPVIAASHELAPGTVLGDGDVRVARVRVGDTIATLFRGSDVASVRGQVVTQAIHAGALVPRG